jgi:hypothetical protein
MFHERHPARARGDGVSETPWQLILLVVLACGIGVGFPLALMVACLKDDK